MATYTVFVWTLIAISLGTSPTFIPAILSNPEVMFIISSKVRSEYTYKTNYCLLVYIQMKISEIPK